MKVVIACGGTGGHLFPGIAVAEELNKRGHHSLLVISEKKVDQEASAKYESLDFRVFPAIAKPATLSLGMLLFLVKLSKAIARSKKLLKEEEVGVVLGMGGFTSFAPIYAGAKLGLRTYVHDSNAIPGRSNLMTAKYCTQVLLGLEAAGSYFAEGQSVHVGTPVRKEFRDLPERKELAEKWEFNLEKPVVLVVGGSQGARDLNTAVIEASRVLHGKIQFLHVAGRGDYERVKEEAKSMEGHQVLAFCEDMREVYSLADLVICRSGASSLAEIAWLALPSILVPYPHAADDHQTANAQVFVEAGAGILRKQDELSGQFIADELKALFSDEARLQKMRDACAKLVVVQAASKIADVIEAGCEGKKK